MSLIQKFEQLHYKAHQNHWMHIFTWFNRILLAWGFFPSGMVKILGERFTSLPDMHPMGAYLEALHHTGFYYTFIGVMQVSAAILILIPRTATLGVIIYFPIILNICILSIAVRFDGSLITSPLMVLSCIYLICWDYHKFKRIFPWYHKETKLELPQKKERSWRFPFAFAASVLATVFIVVFSLVKGFDLYPRNSLKDCSKQCDNDTNPEACIEFCECIHDEGKSLDQCLREYEN